MGDLKDQKEGDALGKAGREGQKDPKKDPHCNDLRS
jgi:hypothetical protein